VLVRLRDYVVEGNLGRLACENMNEEQLLEIEKLHYEMYGCYLRRDLHGYFLFNQQIHQKIVAAADNTILATTYASFAGRLRRVRYSANLARERDRWSEALREHEAILDALRRKAGGELSDILFQHLRNERRALVGDET
jgi:DNA-binding GntR family transcriptional regulator